MLQVFQDVPGIFQSYGKAAEALNYAPSTVTAQVKSLEKEFGVLFERNAFGVPLTPGGQAILPLANIFYGQSASVSERHAIDPCHEEDDFCYA